MNLAISVPKAAHRGVISHIKREAGLFDPLEDLNSVTGLKVEALGSTVIVDPHQHQVLTWNKLSTVHQGVVVLATVLVPVY